MNELDLDAADACYAFIRELKNNLVATVNASIENRQSPNEYYLPCVMALVMALGDLVAVAPEEKQAEVYKAALTLLEQAYVINLTKGNL